METNLALDDELIEEAPTRWATHKKDVLMQAYLFRKVDVEDGFDTQKQHSVGRTPLTDA